MARAAQAQGQSVIIPGESLAARVWRTFSLPAACFVAIHVVGAAGFIYISDGKATVIDAVYMVFITVASIGYGEIVDLSHSPGGRIFNMLIAMAGIATIGYVISKLTVFIVEGRFDEVMRRRKMQDMIDHMNGHYIICGVGRVGTAPRKLADAAPPSREYVVLAVRATGSWQFNPVSDFTLQPGNALVVMATPEGRRALESTMAQ